MNDKENDKKHANDKKPNEGVERGFANRHAETTEPGSIKKQEIPPEVEGNTEELELEADRRRNEGVERGYANRHSEMAGTAAGELLAPAPFSRPRTTAEPEGGYEEGYPKVYFSVYDRVPPIVVKTPKEEAAIDKANFMTIPPEEVDVELTDAKMRAEWRVGDRAAERNLGQPGESRSGYIPAPGESERRSRRGEPANAPGEKSGSERKR